MRVSVFGLGYVGCVTAACLARAGHRVVGVDVSRDKVEMVSRGRSPIVEPGLGDLMKAVVSTRMLKATVSADEAVAETDLALVCVGTPGRGSGQLDTGAIERVGEEIGRALRRPRRYTVLLRSTALPGTTQDRLGASIARGSGRGSGTWVRLGVNPEFMREGSALDDFSHPAMTLAGVEDDETAAEARSLYAETDAPFVR